MSKFVSPLLRHRKRQVEEFEDLGAGRQAALALFVPKRDAEHERAAGLPLTAFAVIRLLRHRATNSMDSLAPYSV